MTADENDNCPSGSLVTMLGSANGISDPDDASTDQNGVYCYYYGRQAWSACSKMPPSGAE